MLKHPGRVLLTKKKQIIRRYGNIQIRQIRQAGQSHKVGSRQDKSKLPSKIRVKS